MGNNRRTYFLLSVLSGLLLYASWPPNTTAPLAFIGFVPLLFAEYLFTSSNRRNFAPFAYISFLIWNALSTYWLWFASPGGAIMAIVLNALLMCVPFGAFRLTKRFLGEFWGYISLPAYWICFEYLHLHWDVSWPWLTLGNVFSSMPVMVQWYEYTGVFGGTLWVWIANLAFFFWMRNISRRGDLLLLMRNGFVAALVIALPVILSAVWPPHIIEEGKHLHVVIVQPNIDPYEDKFNGMSPEQQAIHMIRLAGPSVDEKTDYLIFPETALLGNLIEGQLDQSPVMSIVYEYLRKYPRLTLVSGADTYRFYMKDEKPSVTARKYHSDEENGPSIWYDSYNTALQLQDGEEIQIYHKSRLVPGVEKMPWPAFFKFFESFAIDLGGTSGSLGQQDTPTVFFAPGKAGVAPVICYESVYGDYVAEYVKRGAGLIFIITNDGWWDNTPGHKQHLQYVSLRAIETRRQIARSANTGISAVIDEYGNIHHKTKFWEPAVITATLTAREKQTFYVTYGDLLAYLGILTGIPLLLLTLSRYFAWRRAIKKALREEKSRHQE